MDASQPMPHRLAHACVQAYAFAFFAIPALRWLFNQRRNARIEARNSARAEAARLLNSGQRWLKQVRKHTRLCGVGATGRQEAVGPLACGDSSWHMTPQLVRSPCFTVHAPC